MYFFYNSSKLTAANCFSRFLMALQNLIRVKLYNPQKGVICATK